MSRYAFLTGTYDTERLKILSVWSMFDDADLEIRPHPTDARGRSLREQMIHQCVSEDLWFRNMLGIDVGAPPLPEEETRLAFIGRYAVDSEARLDALGRQSDAWWEESVTFFAEDRSRAWVMVRRVAHSSHHRGQQMAMLRMLGREIHSNYGPTADTGGLMANNAPVIYAYEDVESLIEGESVGGRKSPLPGPGPQAPTERG
jgi:uncharacterized damage-inducible protein DinB